MKFNSGYFLLAAILLTFLIRFYNISERPLHNDEAVNSIKLKYLLEQGEFKYDPVEYHGATLYYISLVSSWLSGNSEFKTLTESHLRGITVVFSLLLFLALFIIREYLSRSTLITTSIFLIISPFINFYSRYFIHEPLFAVFTIFLLVSLFRFTKSNKKVWIILSGIFAGLVFATKETSLIVFFSILLALVFTKSLNKFYTKSTLYFFISFFSVAILFYSSFFTHFEGVADSLITYKNYFTKASSHSEHIQPWYYYLKLLSYSELNRIIISEIIILLLAVVGIYNSFKNVSSDSNKIFLQWITIFSITNFVILSFIPYKTPWSIFTSWIGIIILAGYGFNSIYQFNLTNTFKIILTTAVTFFSINLLYQTYVTSFVYYDIQENPYTYSQPQKEIYDLTEKVEELVNYNDTLFINVIAADNQYWPLPWYFKNSKNIAWNNTPKPDLHNFDIIICEPEFIDHVTNLLYTIPKPGNINLYIPLLEKDVPIRPGKYFASFVKNDFYQEYLNSENQK